MYKTMKKTYINPQTLVVRVNLTASVLQLSSPGVGIDSTGSVDAGSVEVKGSSYNVWSDDWSAE